MYGHTIFWTLLMWFIASMIYLISLQTEDLFVRIVLRSIRDENTGFLSLNASCKLFVYFLFRWMYWMKLLVLSRTATMKTWMSNIKSNNFFSWFMWYDFVKLFNRKRENWQVCAYNYVVNLLKKCITICFNDFMTTWRVISIK